LHEANSLKLRRLQFFWRIPPESVSFLPVFMKNKMVRILVLALGALLFAFSAPAQLAGASGGVDSAMIKLFGDSPTFTATATVQVLGSDGKEWLRMPSTFNALNGKFRLDVDKGQIKSAKLPADAVALDKRLGTDKVSSVTRTDTHVIYIIYPNAQSYVNMPIMGQDAIPANQKLTRSALGHEKINGHACVKNHCLVKNAKGATLLDAITWNASDLHDFPLRVETKENGNTTIMQFQQVAFANPDAKLFEAPGGYQRFNDPNTLLEAVLKKSQATQKK
jgi:hypothetical protein